MERLTRITRVASFGTEQVVKTIRRPRRLIAIPWIWNRVLLGMAARGIARFYPIGNRASRFAVRLTGHLQRVQSERTIGRLDRLFQGAVELLDDNQPLRAWKVFAEG